MLVKRGIEIMLGAVLMVVVMLAVVPAVAQAHEQQRQEEEGRTPAFVVVRPGDTLWAISEERLGANATPRRIAGEVERIYALNRDRIGPDPNLIFAGQILRVPQ